MIHFFTHSVLHNPQKKWEVVYKINFYMYFQTDLEYRNLVRAAMSDGRVTGVAVVASGHVLSQVIAS